MRTEYMLFAGSCLAFLSLCFGIYQILRIGREGKWLRHGWEHILSTTQEIEKKRMEDYKKVLLEYGAQEKIPVLQRWDQLFIQSGLNQWFPFLNGQLYGIFLLGISMAGLLFFTAWKSLDEPVRFLFGLVWAGSVLGGGVLILKVLRGRRRHRTEEELLAFLNIVDNLSRTQQDLFQIFGTAARYLREPIRGTIRACSYHAAQTGNRYGAVQELLYRLDHPKFRELIQHLEICSRNEANFSEVLEDMRENISVYLANQNELRSIRREGRIQVLVILTMGVPMIGMLRVMTQIPLTEMFHHLSGKCILCYWVCLLGLVFWQLLFAEEREVYNAI